MSDSDDFWDDQPKGQNDDEDSAPDDWDVDSDEEREKKVAKEKEEAERKLKQKNMKQKIKEKEERERKEKEERIAELNRVKSEAEKQEEQESAAMKIVDAQLGDFALDDDDTALRREVAEAASSNKKSSSNDSAHPLLTSSIKTKADADKYSDLICDKLYEYRDSSQFNYLLEQVSRKMGERQDFKNHESVKLMGKNLQQIGNKKYTDWKDSKNPKKKKKGASNAPSLAKRADTAMVGLDLDEEFDVDEDDFM